MHGTALLPPIAMPGEILHRRTTSLPYPAEEKMLKIPASQPTRAARLQPT